MIKLIVTDMDGCLLDGSGKLPPDFDRAFSLMKEKNVIFAAASGRSIDGLKIPFGDVAEEMTCISDNGARIFHRGKLLAEKGLEVGDYLPILDEMRACHGMIPVACGTENIWVENEGVITGEEEKEVRKYYPRLKECSFDHIPERVIKFALMHFDNIEKNIYPRFEKYDNDRVCVQVTSFRWIDIYPKSVSKGNALGVLQEKLGISPDETMVFGDYLNDISMADHAALSFAPANAHPEVKQYFTGTIRSNAEYGVTGKIIEIVGNGDGS